MDKNSGDKSKDVTREAETSQHEENIKTKKVGQGEYASVEDSPKGDQLRNTDEVVGTA